MKSSEPGVWYIWLIIIIRLCSTLSTLSRLHLCCFVFIYFFLSSLIYISYCLFYSLFSPPPPLFSLNFLQISSSSSYPSPLVAFFQDSFDFQNNLEKNDIIWYIHILSFTLPILKENDYNTTPSFRRRER